MPGFLDPRAPSIEAEYTRYLDNDILGKILFKNLCRNVLRFPDDELYVPLGKWGDIGGRLVPKADAVIEQAGRRLEIEVKCAKVNIANRYAGRTRKTWSFGRFLTTPAGQRREFDIAVGIGVMLLGLEEPRYWEYLDQYKRELQLKQILVAPHAQPHEAMFLPMCGFFIMPLEAVRTNRFALP
jgi:hypothetical protein